jgi:hypothetical protein
MLHGKGIGNSCDEASMMQNSWSLLVIAALLAGGVAAQPGDKPESAAQVTTAGDEPRAGSDACPLQGAAAALERTGDLAEIWVLAREDLGEMTAAEQSRREVLLQAVLQEAPALSLAPATVSCLRGALQSEDEPEVSPATTDDPARQTFNQLLALRARLLGRATAVLQAAGEAFEFAGGERAFSAPGCAGCREAPPAGPEPGSLASLQRLNLQWLRALASARGCGTTCEQVKRISARYRELEATCPLAFNLAESTAELAVLLDLARRIDGRLVELIAVDRALAGAVPRELLAALAEQRPRLLAACELAGRLSLGIARITATKSPVQSPLAAPR